MTKLFIIDEWGRIVPSELYALRMQQQAHQPQPVPFSTADVDPARVRAALESRSDQVTIYQREKHHTDTPEGRAWGQSVYENAVQMKVTQTDVHSMQATFVLGHDGS